MKYIRHIFSQETHNIVKKTSVFRFSGPFPLLQVDPGPLFSNHLNQGCNLDIGKLANTNWMQVKLTKT